MGQQRGQTENWGSTHRSPTDKWQLFKSPAYTEGFQNHFNSVGFFLFLLLFCAPLSCTKFQSDADKTHSAELAIEGQIFGDRLSHVTQRRRKLFSFQTPTLLSHPPSYLTYRPVLTSHSKLWVCSLYLLFFFLFCSLYGCY